jgi:hypothetical protein
MLHIMHNCVLDPLGSKCVLQHIYVVHGHFKCPISIEESSQIEDISFGVKPEMDSVWICLCASIVYPYAISEVNPAYATMGYPQLRDELLKSVATGNNVESQFLHTTKDLAKCAHIISERGHRYNGRVVEIDISAASPDDYIDLSSRASSNAFIFSSGSARRRFAV